MCGLLQGVILTDLSHVILLARHAPAAHPGGVHGKHSNQLVMASLKPVFRDALRVQMVR